MLETIRKLNHLLSPRERRQALLLLALMLLMGLVEVVGVASILPLIAVVSDPTLVQSNEWLRLSYRMLGFSDTNGYLIFLSAMVFLIVVGRTALSAFCTYAMLRYAHMRSHALSVRLLSTYLGHRYEWFLNRHSADMNKSVLSEVDQLVHNALMPMLTLASQGIVALCIIALVVVVDPGVALVATAAIGFAYGGVYLAIRGVLNRYGHERLLANRDRYQIAQEVLGGVKEVKVGGLEQGFLRRFQHASHKLAHRQAVMRALGVLPRYFLEVLLIGGMLAVIMVLLARADGNLAAVLPVMGLYAFAALRLLPVIQGLYNSVVALRSAGPVLDSFHADLTDSTYDAPEQADVVPLPLTRAITLTNVHFAYPRAERTALHEVNLTIVANTTVGVIGVTGAGKSTLVDLILGLLQPSEGTLSVDGVIIGPHNVRAWQRAIGYVPQHIFLADETVAQNIAFGQPPDKVNMEAVERAARMAMLHDFIVGELPQGYETPIGERGIRLSGGQRQRIGIARALYHDPDVVVLDEATSALDNLTEQAVIESVKNLSRKKTIIMIAHRLTTLRDCDEIIRMREGHADVLGGYSAIAHDASGVFDVSELA